MKVKTGDSADFEAGFSNNLAAVSHQMAAIEQDRPYWFSDFLDHSCSVTNRGEHVFGEIKHTDFLKKQQQQNNYIYGALHKIGPLIVL